MEPLKYKDLLISFTTEFTQLWNDKGTRAKQAVTFWRPSTSTDHLTPFYSLGDVAVGDYQNINQHKIVAVVSEVDKDNGTALRMPDDFELVWKHSGPRVTTACSVWRPIAPNGYVAMGLVCGVGNDKPPRSTLRCIREDLVVESQADALIWNDKGSGALTSFSAWTVVPPLASPGEALLAPGTFAGAGSYTKPGLQPTAYALRIALTLHYPALPPEPAHWRPGPESAPSAYELPWFTVKDAELSPVEQLQSSPIYRLERTDRHALFASERNETDSSKIVNWQSPKGENYNYSLQLKTLTGIEISGEWAANTPASALYFSARLDSEFTHGSSTHGWGNMTIVEVIVYVPANQYVDAYITKSNYTLLRKDGSQSGPELGYFSEVKLHFHEPAEQVPAETVEPEALPPAAETTLEVATHDVSDNALVP
ncbi:hypothetical protein BK649_10330 [Pseudomonas canadensis]|uniref:DUF946 domain-containing protein n=1 Tax=Pseudomonas canadensis TaxID=915099 RepID=A0A423FBH7_9PSED|nr:Vps62-related protein [Pseudomonas canadensis]ROM54013.1 hypothetical protein BK649_10330 [Pseudomonas canadensis]